MVFGKTAGRASQILLGERSTKKKAIIPTIVMGVGIDMTLRAVDRLIGSPLQRFAGINIPFVGNVGVIDLATFLVTSSGGKNIKQGAVAVAGAKFIGGTLPSLGNIQLPGQVTAGQGSGVAAGAAGAPV